MPLYGSKKKRTLKNITMSHTKSYLKDLIYEVNGAAIEVHKALGSGLLESVYHKCMAHELKLRNLNFISELPISLDYKGLKVETLLRCDFLVEDILVVELKSVKEVSPIHQTILLSYMKLLSNPIGLMINFNVSNIYKEGQKTYVNELYRNLPN